tara:strand:+ start:1092 stop:1400 length:309 start_codon:yes stop_codon:yes gene_type:complete
MNVSELIELLEEYRDITGENTEVRFANQPSWPFENSISDVTAISKEIREEILRDELSEAGIFGEEANEKIACEEIPEEAFIYIGEGSQIGYLDGEVKALLGW